MRRPRGRFDDDELLDRLLASMESRVGRRSAAMAVADVLIDYACAGQRPCDSPKGSPRMLRRWQHFEDRITEELARSTGMRPTAAMRFHAIELVGLVRCITSTEPWADPAMIEPYRLDEFARWVRNTARAIGD